jgi:hypothetical protein
LADEIHHLRQIIVHAARENTSTDTDIFTQPSIAASAEIR